MKTPPVEKKVLDSRLAGSWYTANPAELEREIQGYLDAVTDPPLESVMALVLPHAGYAYSGQIAAFGAKQVEGRAYSRVVVLGPTHRVAMRNVVSVPRATHFRTPLGTIPLDTEFIERIGRHAVVRSLPEAESGEHSVEIEFPLLQVALGDFRLVPVTVGQLDDGAVRDVARALRAEIDERTLVVASTDFTHYGPRFDYVPFREDVPANLRTLDMGAFEFLRGKDLAGFRGYIERTGATICGRDTMSVLIAMLPEEAEVRLLKYDTSGRLTGDWENVVSYVSAAVAGRWPATRAERRPAATATAAAAAAAAPALALSGADRRQLLRLARGTLEFYLAHRRKPTPAEIDVALTDGMKQIAGAFVTLHRRGNLRGCIGEIVPTRELYLAVMDHALNAGLKDPRFPRVTAEEMAEIDVEISALSPPREVGSWRDIVIGRHGIVLAKDGRSAVFLPQVAPEQKWGIEETLTHLALKAGLDPDAWREDAEFSVFEAVVFGEKGRP